MNASQGLLQGGQYVPPHTLCIPLKWIQLSASAGRHEGWMADICIQFKWTLTRICLRQNCECICIALPAANMRHHALIWPSIESGFICDAGFAYLLLQPCQLRTESMFTIYVSQYLTIYIKIVNLPFLILFSVHELHFWRSIQYQERLLWTSQQACQHNSVFALSPISA